MRPLRSLLSSLAFWLGLADAYTARTGLVGLNWGGRWAGITLASLAAWAAPTPPWALLAGLLPAASAQVALASLRRCQLNPRQRLYPRVYPDRQITRLDLPAAYGPVPALHIVPNGGACAAVCVAHGSGCDKSFYAWRLADQMVAQGLALLLIDLDGHGESPRPQDFPAMIAGISGPLSWLHERYPRVGMLGMSLGGAVAARAVAEGALCNALALWAAPPRLRLNATAYRQAQIREGLRLVRPQLLHLLRDGSPYHVIRAWQTSGIRARIGTWDLFDALDLPGSLRSLRLDPDRPPLLLYYAGSDAVLPSGSLEEVRQLTADWGSLRVVRGASHVSLPIELEVIKGTTAWFREQLSCQ